MNILLVLSLCLAAVGAGPARENRIVGGSVTTIQRYPFATVILSNRQNPNFAFWCGGTIINNRSILSATHCFWNHPANRYRVRIGSTYSGSGGTVLTLNRLIHHPNYNSRTLDNDCSILRVNGNININNNNIGRASFPGPNYNLRDGQQVWAIGWGAIRYGGPTSPNLRHVQVYTINQNICAQRYGARRPSRAITANMLCSGVLDRGGRDACQGDSGGPLLHHGVVVGITSFGHECAHARYPGVNARVTRLIGWINGQA